MDPEDGLDDDEPLFAWLPPEDRLWRHPSEQHLVPPASPPRSAWSGSTSSWRHSAAMRTGAVAVAAGVVGALLATGVGVSTGVFAHRTTVVQNLSRYASSDTVALADSGSGNPNWPSVADALSPAVVGLAVNTPDGELTGSGVIYSSSANRCYVLTDARLLQQAGRVTVTFADGTSQVGHLVTADPVSDIAVLWVGTGDASQANLGTVADLRVAQPVMTLAAGSPDGNADPGTVTSLDDQVQTVAGATVGGLITMAGSGGPASATGGAVVDASGAVVGIGVSVDPANPLQQDLSFAVPIDVAEQVAAQALDGKALSHPWLGVADTSDLPSAIAQKMGVAGGVEVGAVSPGGPAARAGLVASDVIVDYDGQAVTTAGTLIENVAQSHPGERVAVTYLAGGTLHRTSILVGNQPAPAGG